MKRKYALDSTKSEWGSKTGARGGSPMRGWHLGVSGSFLLLLSIFRRDFVSIFSGSSDSVPAAN